MFYSTIVELAVFKIPRLRIVECLQLQMKYFLYFTDTLFQMELNSLFSFSECFTAANGLALVYSCESNEQLILLPAQRRTMAQWVAERARNTQNTGLGHFRLRLSIIEVEKRSTKIKTRNQTIKTKHTSTLGFAAVSAFV